MTDLRDKIADVFECHEDEWTCYVLADAIIAALPDMVAPLVWERADLTCWGETAHNRMGGSYRMTWEFGDGPNGEDTFFTVRFDGVGLYSGWSFDADLAMAAANAHHAAAVVAAITGEKP